MRRCAVAVALCCGAFTLIPAWGCGSGGGTQSGGGAGSGTLSFSSFQVAAVVIGQADFASSMPNQGGAAGANTLSVPTGVATGSLFVADVINNRVLGFNTPPGASGAAADFVLGQPDFATTDNVGAPSATKFSQPYGVCVSGGKFFMLSANQSRLLIWNTVPTSTGALPDVVLGQSDFMMGGASTNGTGFEFPEGVCAGGGRLVVADTGNRRVMIWNTVPTITFLQADLALGQPDFVTDTGGTSATKLQSPRDVWTDGTRLVVCDTGNRRVLIWLSFPTANDTPADVVLGQVNFTTNALAAGPSGMASPSGVASDGTRLYVADGGNNRVLIWNTFPTSNAQPADAVLGQGDFNRNESNDDNQDGVDDGAPSARTLNAPIGLAILGNQLFVVDSNNQRVLIFNGN